MKITIIGAGVIGLACAYELSELGHDVTVIDAGRAGAGASAGNAGWVTPFLSTPRAAPGVVSDALRSFTDREGPARMRPHVELGFATWILKFLRASTKRRSAAATAALQSFAQGVHRSFDSLQERGVEFTQFTDGLGVVCREEAHLLRYEQLAQRLRELGYAGRVRVHRGPAAAEFDPALRRDLAGVLHLEEERHVRPESLTLGLADALVAGGGELVENTAVTAVARRSRSWTVRGAGKEWNSDVVVIASGLSSRGLLASLGVHLPLEAAKGTSMTAVGDGTTPRHPLKLYENMVACSPFGRSVRLSGTFDIGARDSRLDRRRLATVVRQSRSYLRDWRPTEVQCEWVGHRPTTVDDLPVIGPVQGHHGLYVATGHGTLGITLGPLTGSLAAQEIATGVPQKRLAPFRLDRFRHSSAR